MVTRRVEPAAFTSDLPVTFVVIDDFTAALHGDDPPLGHLPIREDRSWLG